jgi:hypothetical protein
MRIRPGPLAVRALGLVVLTRVLAVLSKPLTFSGYSFDEQWFVWGGWSILKGLAPYKDFHDFKPPVLFLSEAAAIGLLGGADQRFRLFFATLAVVATVAVAAALMKRGVGPVLALVPSLLIASLYFDSGFHDSSLNDSESIGLAYVLAGFAFLIGGPRALWSQAVGAGFLTLSVLTKEPFLFIAGPAWIVGFFDGQGESITRPWRSYLKASVIGGAVPAVLILTYLAICGGLRPYLEGYPRARQFAENYAVQLGIFTPGPFRDVARQDWAHLSSVIFNLGRMGTWLPLFAAGLVAARGKRWPRLLAALLTLAGSAYAITIGHCFWSHYFVMGVGGLGVLAAVCCLELRAATASGQAQCAFGVLAGMAVALQLYPRYDADAHKVFLPAAPNVSPTVLDYVVRNTRPDDYILATQAGLYFFAQRRSALTYNAFLDELIHVYPGKNDDDRLARLRAQIEQHKPKIIYVYPAYLDRMKRELDALIYPVVQQGHYQAVQEGLYVRPDALAGVR